MLEIHGSKPLRVVVVSIGRSGTSLFARILDEVLGVEFGDETDHIPRNHNNPDGYFENAEFLAFNDRVLQAAGGWVLDPPALDYAARMDGNQRQELVAEAGHLLNRYAADKPTFGWKDPRLSFTLPIWRAACPEIVPIIAFRKPYSVLSSIGAQLDRPIESLAGLWFRYYQHVFTHTEGLPRYFASFDQLLTDPASVVRGMAQHLGREIDESVVAKQLAEIVKPLQSRHSSAQNASNRPPIIDSATMSVYDYLTESVAHQAGQPDPQHLRRLLRL
ncbi:MAG: sulfotransferase family protein [Burkholderiales bacterium]|jgi:hypothetical protein